MGLYEQADKLGFLKLKDICSQHLIQYIDKDNCIATLVFADANNDQSMKEAASDCLDENAEELLESLKNNVISLELMSDLYLRVIKKLKST